MNTMNSLISASVFTLLAFTASAQADNSLDSLIYEESANIYSEVTYQSSMPEGILSFGDNANENALWSTEYEQYVSSTDFQQTAIASISDVNQYMDNKPSASGVSNTGNTFIYNDTAGEYHLQ